jgi:hypothetical protein
MVSATPTQSADKCLSSIPIDAIPCFVVLEAAAKKILSSEHGRFHDGIIGGFAVSRK